MMQDDVAVPSISHSNTSTFQYGDSAHYVPAPPSLATEGDEDGEFPANVESLVYYFSIQIEPIPPSASNHSFYRDPIRTKMILKFMKFYSWCPGLKGSPYDQRRDQLKLHLKLDKGKLCQLLSSFMSGKFNYLRDNGWISGDKSRPPVKYHEATDHWLEQSWDGIIRLGKMNPTTGIRSLKRAASPSPYKDGVLTRHKSRTRDIRNICAAVTSIPHPETVNSVHGPVTRNSSDVCTNEDTGVEGSYDEASGNIEPIIHNLVTPDDPINATDSHYLNSNNLLIIASPTATATSPRRLERGDVESYFNASELSALLEGLTEDEPVGLIGGGATFETFEEFEEYNTEGENQTRSSDVQEPTRQVSNAHNAPSVNEPRQTLETLVELERSCRTACNAIVAEKIELKSIHDQLCADNNKLHEEIETFCADFEEANRRLKNKTPPTPALGVGVFARAPTPFHQNVPEIRRKLADPEWTESRKAARAVLSQEIGKINDKYKDLGAQYDVKAAELKRLRATITKEMAREKARKAEIASLLEGFERYDALDDPQSEWISDIDLDSKEDDD